MMQQSRFFRPVTTLAMFFAAVALACAQQTAPGSQDASAFIEGVTGHGQPDLRTLDEIRAAGYGVVILNGKTPHAVLLELFTDHGAGTLIRP